MKISEQKLHSKDGFGSIKELIATVSCSHALAVNPRAGDYLQTLIERNTIIDSFVSDDEWISAAKQFSENVYTGYSSKPLLKIEDATYDAIIVSEDIGYADDCDAMLKEYFRLLKPKGALLGGIFNIRYAGNINSFLRDKGLYEKNKLCGSGLISLDGLLERLGGLGFCSADVYNLQDDGEDCTAYTAVSNKNVKPVAQEIFSTKIHFIQAVK